MSNLERFEYWKKWFESSVIEDITKVLYSEARGQPSPQIGLIILSLIGTEALSGYFAGREAGRSTFVEFIKVYFPPAYAAYSN